MPVQRLYLIAKVLTLAFLFIRRYPFPIFLTYLFAGSLSGLFWHPVATDEWWKIWLLSFSPISMALQLACIVELWGKLARNNRVVLSRPFEQRAVSLGVLAIVTIVALITWRGCDTSTDTLIFLRTYVRSVSAFLMLAGFIYYLARPLHAPPVLWYHATILCVFYIVGAAINIMDSLVSTQSQWRWSTNVWLAISIFVMSFWCLVAHDHYQYIQRLQRLQPHFRFGLRQTKTI